MQHELDMWKEMLEVVGQWDLHSENHIDVNTQQQYVHEESIFDNSLLVCWYHLEQKTSAGMGVYLE
jgi:hypothetical protein